MLKISLELFGQGCVGVEMDLQQSSNLFVIVDAGNVREQLRRDHDKILSPVMAASTSPLLIETGTDPQLPAAEQTISRYYLLNSRNDLTRDYTDLWQLLTVLFKDSPQILTLEANHDEY